MAILKPKSAEETEGIFQLDSFTSSSSARIVYSNFFARLMTTQPIFFAGLWNSVANQRALRRSFVQVCWLVRSPRLPPLPHTHTSQLHSPIKWLWPKLGWTHGRDWEEGMAFDEFARSVAVCSLFTALSHKPRAQSKFAPCLQSFDSPLGLIASLGHRSGVNISTADALAGSGRSRTIDDSNGLGWISTHRRRCHRPDHPHWHWGRARIAITTNQSHTGRAEWFK